MNFSTLSIMNRVKNMNLSTLSIMNHVKSMNFSTLSIINHVKSMNLSTLSIMIRVKSIMNSSLVYEFALLLICFACVLAMSELKGAVSKACLNTFTLINYKNFFISVPIYSLWS
jgi:hypothetical protein